MTAARLRAAAAVLREVAEGATPGPWRVERRDDDPPFIYDVVEMREDSCSVVSGEYYQACSEADARYIATMSPPVALAVAAWLEQKADAADDRIGLWVAPERDWTGHPALAVADAVLGDRAEVGS